MAIHTLQTVKQAIEISNTAQLLHKASNGNAIKFLLSEYSKRADPIIRVSGQLFGRDANILSLLEGVINLCSTEKTFNPTKQLELILSTTEFKEPDGLFQLVMKLIKKFRCAETTLTHELFTKYHRQPVIALAILTHAITQRGRDFCFTNDKDGQPVFSPDLRKTISDYLKHPVRKYGPVSKLNKTETTKTVILYLSHLNQVITDHNDRAELLASFMEHRPRFTGEEVQQFCQQEFYTAISGRSHTPLNEAGGGGGCKEPSEETQAFLNRFKRLKNKITLLVKDVKSNNSPSMLDIIKILPKADQLIFLAAPIEYHPTIPTVIDKCLSYNSSKLSDWIQLIESQPIENKLWDQMTYPRGSGGDYKTLMQQIKIVPAQIIQGLNKLQPSDLLHLLNTTASISNKAARNELLSVFFEIPRLIMSPRLRAEQSEGSLLKWRSHGRNRQCSAQLKSTLIAVLQFMDKHLGKNSDQETKRMIDHCLSIDTVYTGHYYDTKYHHPTLLALTLLYQNNQATKFVLNMMDKLGKTNALRILGSDYSQITVTYYDTRTIGIINIFDRYHCGTNQQKNTLLTWVQDQLTIEEQHKLLYNYPYYRAKLSNSEINSYWPTITLRSLLQIITTNSPFKSSMTQELITAINALKNAYQDKKDITPSLQQISLILARRKQNSSYPRTLAADHKLKSIIDNIESVLLKREIASEESVVSFVDEDRSDNAVVTAEDTHTAAFSGHLAKLDKKIRKMAETDEEKAVKHLLLIFRNKTKQKESFLDLIQTYCPDKQHLAWGWLRTIKSDQNKETLWLELLPNLLQENWGGLCQALRRKNINPYTDFLPVLANIISTAEPGRELDSAIQLVNRDKFFIELDLLLTALQTLNQEQNTTIWRQVALKIQSSGQQTRETIAKAEPHMQSEQSLKLLLKQVARNSDTSGFFGINYYTNKALSILCPNKTKRDRLVAPFKRQEEKLKQEQEDKLKQEQKPKKLNSSAAVGLFRQPKPKPSLLDTIKTDLTAIQTAYDRGNNPINIQKERIFNELLDILNTTDATTTYSNRSLVQLRVKLTNLRSESSFSSTVKADTKLSQVIDAIGKLVTKDIPMTTVVGDAGITSYSNS